MVNIKKIIFIFTLVYCCAFLIGITLLCQQNITFFTKYLCVDGFCGTITGTIFIRRI